MLSLCSPVPIVCSPVPMFHGTYVIMFHGTYVIMFHGTYVTRTYVPGISGVSRGFSGCPVTPPPPAMIFFLIRAFTSLQADLSQFQDFLAKMRLPPGLRPGPRWGAYSAPRPPAGNLWVRPKMNPPFRNPGYTGLVWYFSIQKISPMP